MGYSVRYTLTDEDLNAIVRAKQPLGIRGQLIGAVAYLILAPLFLSLIMTGTSGQFSSDFAISDFVMLYAVNFVVWGGLLALGFALRKRLLYPYMARHHGYRKGESAAVDLDENGVTWSHDGRNVQIAWPKIIDGRDDGDRLFMFAGNREVVMVPRHAVASDAEYQAITRYAEQHAHG